MVRLIDVRFIDQGNTYKEFAGKSTDSKPTEDVTTGSTFIEVDTGDVYLFEEEAQTWHKVGD